MSVIKLFGGTLHLDGSHVQWETRQKVYRFVVGCSYDRNYKGRGKHTVTAVSAEGVVTLQSVVDARVSHSQVQSFVGSYGVAQQKKDVKKLREEERERKKLEKALVSIGSKRDAGTPSPPPTAVGNTSAAALSKIVLGCLWDMEKRMDEKLAAHAETLRTELAKQMDAQHNVNHLVLQESLQRVAASIYAQGREIEAKLVETIVKGLS